MNKSIWAVSSVLRGGYDEPMGDNLPMFVC